MLVPPLARVSNIEIWGSAKSPERLGDQTWSPNGDHWLRRTRSKLRSKGVSSARLGVDEP